MSAASRGERGFTLLELLVGCLLGALVTAAGVELLRVHVGIARRLQARLAAVGGAGWALAVAARDAELAGGDPTGAGAVRALALATDARLVLEGDRDGDGIADPGTAERVTLAWSSSSGGRFVRWLGAQSTSIAARVPAGGFRLRYFDEAGLEVAPPGPGLEMSSAARDRVRRVVLELDVVERSGTLEERTSLRTSAALRSRLEER